MQNDFEPFSSADDVLSMSRAKTVRDGLRFFEVVAMPSRNLSARTRVEYHNDLAQLVQFLEGRGKGNLGAVSLGDLEWYQAEMDGRGLAPASRRRKTHSIKTFFDFLYTHGSIASNIADRLIPPRAPRQEPRWLTEREYKDLLRACSHQPRDAAIIELFLQTGMRLSELARLTLSDIELPATITPEPDNVGFARVRRKAGRMEQIPLNYKASRSLRSWMAHRPVCEYDSLFVTKYQTPISRRAIQAAVARYLTDAGIRGASVHSLRHTMATHHAARGTDLRTLQETLGHADLATTAMYMSLAKKAQRQALQEHAL